MRADLVEAHGEWQVAGQRYLSGDSMTILTTPPPQAKEVGPDPL